MDLCLFNMYIIIPCIYCLFNTNNIIRCFFAYFSCIFTLFYQTTTFCQTIQFFLMAINVYCITDKCCHPINVLINIILKTFICNIHKQASMYHHIHMQNSNRLNSLLIVVVAFSANYDTHTYHLPRKQQNTQQPKYI